MLCGALLLQGGTGSALSAQADSFGSGKVSADGFVTKIDSTTSFEVALCMS